MFDDPNNGKSPIEPATPLNINDLKPSGGITLPITGNSGPQGGSKPPTAIEDIFNETEKPAVFAPKEPGTPAQGVTDVENMVPSVMPRRVLIGLVVITGVLLVAYGAYMGYNYWKNNGAVEVIETPVTETEEKNSIIPATDITEQPAATTETNATDTTSVPSTTTPEPTQTVSDTVTPPVTSGDIDTDADGLFDTEEIELGTDVNNPDSDTDGLSDRQETRVYKTNPLNSDSDGDGYLDGAEVSGGYNPSGAGKLYEIQQ